MSYKVGSLFAGIGGICIGFKQAGCEISWANEIDSNACKTYLENSFSEDTELFEQDVCTFSPPSDVDILTGGFPCQPYSIAGKMKGLNDDRGQPMFEQILRIAKLCNPKIIFMENVSNLKNFDKGATYPKMMKMLDDAGYQYHTECILNSREYSGIAQNRKRIYIFAFKEKNYFNSFLQSIGDGLEKIPIIENKDTIIDLNDEKSKKYYYSFDDPEKCRSKRYFEHFVPFVTSKDFIYNYRRKYMRINKKGDCPALTACMGGGGHNVPIILDNFGIRKLTPEECLLFQGFPKNFKFPYEMADSHKYKQAGNSVTIPVVKRLAEKIVESLEVVDSLL